MKFPSPLRVAFTPVVIVFLTFMLVWAWGYSYVRENSVRDPSSMFYDIDKAHTPRYSHVRMLEAEHFIGEYGDTETFRRKSNGAGDKPFMCVGIPTMARKGVRYFRNCVGSLLHGLDERERQQIFLMPFFAQSNASMHPAYSEKWVENVVDEILEYDPSMVDMEELRKLERDETFNRKGLVDYCFLLKKCRATGAEYVTILEDDTLALHGWFHRVKHALAVAEEKTDQRGRTKFTYLRLFWTEEYLGWSKEHQFKHIFWVVFWIFATGAACIGVRAFVPPARKYLTFYVALLLTFFCAPMLISLVFMAGRASSVGLGTGVQEMDQHGCCGQGMAIQKAMVQDLLDWYEGKEVGFIDSLTEDFATQTGNLRWALFPSVLQHMGTKSSKDTSDRRVRYNRIWNHAFEMNDPFVLKDEHDAEMRAYTEKD